MLEKPQRSELKQTEGNQIRIFQCSASQGMKLWPSQLTMYIEDYGTMKMTLPTT